jgi:hypothetical protein
MKRVRSEQWVQEEKMGRDLGSIQRLVAVLGRGDSGKPPQALHR